MLKILFFLFVVLVFVPNPALAHIVKSENSIGAVLHVDPEDDPIAGSESTLFIEFKDTENKFNLSNCDCKIVVTRDSEEVISQNFGPVSETETLSAAIPVTFPEKSIYQLKVMGSPKIEGVFSNFELNFEVRVARDNSEVETTVAQQSWFEKNIIPIVGFGVLFALIAGAVVSKRGKN